MRRRLNVSVLFDLHVCMEFAEIKEDPFIHYTPEMDGIIFIRTIKIYRQVV